MANVLHVFPDAIILAPTAVETVGDALFRTTECLRVGGVCLVGEFDGLGATVVETGNDGLRGFNNAGAWRELAAPNGSTWTIEVVDPSPTALARVRYGVNPLFDGPLYANAFTWTEPRLLGYVSQRVPFSFWFALVRGPEKLVHHLWFYDALTEMQWLRDNADAALVGDESRAPALYAEQHTLCPVAGTSVALRNPTGPAAVFRSAFAQSYITVGAFVLPWQGDVPEGYVALDSNWSRPDDQRAGMQVQQRRRGGLGGEV